jgi:hypothetical protein
MARQPIYLTDEERAIATDFVKNGTHNAHLITRARVILMLDRTGKSDHMRITRTAKANDVARQAVYDMMDDFLAAEDMHAYLRRKEKDMSNFVPIIDGEAGARILAMICGEPPEGYAKWTLELIAEKTVELKIVPTVSEMTIQRFLKKTNISLI